MFDTNILDIVLADIFLFKFKIPYVLWSAKINNMAHLCRPDIVGSIGGMKITKTRNKSTTASAHGLLLFSAI